MEYKVFVCILSSAHNFVHKRYVSKINDNSLCIRHIVVGLNNKHIIGIKHRHILVNKYIVEFKNKHEIVSL